MSKPTLHARHQMARRRITQGELDDALTRIETAYPARDHPDREVVLCRTFGGRRFKVVRPYADPDVIITVADRGIEE